MCYTIRFNFGEYFDEYENVTKNTVENLLIKDFEKYRKMFGLNSESFEEFEEYEQKDFTPMSNYVHILSSTPTEQQIVELAKLTTQVVVYIEELDTYGIALTGVGMDMSAYIELAYRIIDKESPVKGDLSICDEAVANKVRELRKQN
jgi:hypothetical protein